MALAGINVLEIAGLAPAPFAGMILADFGANVVRIDRTEGMNPDNLSRGKRSVSIDIKSPQGRDLVLRMVEKADVLIEPFRPGVLEKLGLGPDVLLARNPKIIVARLTGFGQTGAYAKMAGHDINYIATSGVLSLVGREGENPIFPLNLLGDFAAGGMLCVMGILLALLERRNSGRGQVIDSAMIDGTAYLGSFLFNMKSAGQWDRPRGRNLLDTGAHFYETYKTKDGKYMSVGAIEKQFYAALLKGLGLHKDKTLPHQMDFESWPAMKGKFKAIFASKTQDEWCKIFDGTDACVAPVLNLEDVLTHQHARDRKLLIPSADYPDMTEPAPAPRLSRTPGLPNAQAPSRPDVGQHSAEVLKEYGFSEAEIALYLAKGVVSKL